MNLSKSIKKNEQRIKILYSLLLFFLVIIIRKNSFENFLINYDEAEWLYCIKRLGVNFNPFSGFDSHTSGPFAIYLLSPISIIKNFNIVDLRIYGTLILFIPIILIYKKTLIEFIIISSVYTSFLLLFDKDFIAYNTEWLIITFLFFIIDFYDRIKNENKFQNYLIFSFLIFIIVLIKFQTILFSGFFFFLIILKLIKNKRYKEIKSLIFSSLIVALLLVLFFISTSSFNMLIENYLIRNLQHTKLINTKPIRDVLYVFRESIFEIFKYHIFIGIILFSFAFKKIGLKELTKQLNFEILFLIITLITIFIPRTNWHHYFQMLFVVTTFIITKLVLIIKENQNIKWIISFNILLFSLIIYENIKYNKVNTYKISSPNVNTITQLIPFNSKIIVLGWFEALPIYYKLLHKYKYINHTGHTFYLSLFKKKSELFKSEFTPIKNLLTNKNKLFIIDPENTIGNLNNSELNKIINQKFIIISKYKTGLIYKKK